MGSWIKVLVLLAPAIFLLGCGPSEPKVEGRWYSQSQVDRGKVLFSENCVVCHGAEARGTPDWHKPLPNGKYPPPPLDGSAHAWHHPLRALMFTVQNGGAKFGGTMPGFKGQLDENQQEAVIAYFQSLWSEQIYQAWLQRGGLK